MHPHIEDALRRMLVVDPHKRIEWAELFRHPVTRLLEENIEQNLRNSMLCNKEELPFNMSKFYIKTNRVVENLHEISAKRELNAYVKDVIHTREQAPYSGALIRRQAERTNKENNLDLRELPTKTEKELKEEEDDPQALKKEEEAARAERIRRNCKLLLHHRNVYAFLGHLAEEVVEAHYNDYFECLAFLLLKKVMSRISLLRQAVKKREVKGVVAWSEFEGCR